MPRNLEKELEATLVKAIPVVKKLGYDDKVARPFATVFLLATTHPKLTKAQQQSGKVFLNGGLPLLLRSRLSQKQVLELWKQSCDNKSRDGISMEEFFTLLHLVALKQNNLPSNRLSNVPLPRFRGILLEGQTADEDEDEDEDEGDASEAEEDKEPEEEEEEEDEEAAHERLFQKGNDADEEEEEHATKKPARRVNKKEANRLKMAGKSHKAPEGKLPTKRPNAQRADGGKASGSKTEQQQQQQQQQSKRGGKDKKKNDGGDAGEGGGAEKCCTFKRVVLFIVLLVLLGGMAVLRFKDDEYLGMDLDSISDFDAYKVLESSPTDSLEVLKKKYRALVVKWHPDKNPGCGTKCDEMITEIGKAWQLVGNVESRKAYDATSGSFSSLSSEAVELTAENFDALVTQSDDFWVIQVYVDWDKSCIHFSQAWEETISKWDDSVVRFGRVHAKREMSLLRRLPVSFKIVPSIVSYAAGKFGKTKTFTQQQTRTLMSLLSDFIEQEIPSRMVNLRPDPTQIVKFLDPQQWPQGNSSLSSADRAAVVLFPKKSAGRPPVFYQALSYRFRDSISFGFVQAPSLVTDAIEAAFPQMPSGAAALVRVSSAGRPHWVAAQDRSALVSAVEELYRSMVPQLTPAAYVRHCERGGKGSAAASSLSSHGEVSPCVLLLRCANTANDDRVMNDRLLAVKSLQKRLSPQMPLIQFAAVDAPSSESFAPLCRDIDNQAATTIVLVAAKHLIKLPSDPVQAAEAVEGVLRLIEEGDLESVSHSAKPLPALSVDYREAGSRMNDMLWVAGGAVAVAVFTLIFRTFVTTNLGVNFVVLMMFGSIAFQAWKFITTGEF